MTAEKPKPSETEPAGDPGGLAVRPDEAWPFFAEDEIEAAAAVLRSGKVNQWTGPEVFRFQEACTEAFGGGRGIALANGSLALELALRAFGIGPGDEVIVTPRTFVASAFCAQLVGATPVFADVDPDSGNITERSIRAVLTERSKAVIPVHLAGWPAEMPAIVALASEHGLRVIEDCAQAQGAEIGGRPVGSFGDAAAFSFCQDKIITTGGEGGFVSFRDEAEWEWAWSFKDHGKSWTKMNAPSLHPGLFRWVHDSVGTNWRLTGPQAAIGLAQLAKLPRWIEARTRNAAVWAAALAGIEGLRVPLPKAPARHAFYKFYFYVDRPNAAELRARILQRSAEAGLRVFSGSCSEVYREEAFADLAVAPLPTAAKMSDNSLMVEVHPTLRPDLLERRALALADIVRDVLG
ncbi:DegT/DnrJ/EryC1/StrS family aminotransferase [Allosphingosinicella sp.]|jgi:dTDP-4-amino-4,6-dideoxygalactose transaminase|uniref:DegT/DnrJ/EryC1/StrS family aminotransferase n=1 Tax=Allosphingosinicella sp. TaxID=2823234 RepID=UPI002EF75108